MRPFALLGILLLTAGVSPCEAASPRLVLISIDGLRPDFYQKPEYRKAAPHLAKLADTGSPAPHGIAPIFPSVTYPDHTSMVTGAYSAEHGVYYNEIFSPTAGPTSEWYWYEREIKLPTLWQVAENAGLKVALLRWPVSTGARVHWDLPEIFVPSDHFDIPADWKLIQESTTPKSLIRDALSGGALHAPQSMADLDRIAAQAMRYLLDHEAPEVILIHLVDLDRAQHEYGTESPNLLAVLAGIDANLRKITETLDEKRTTLIVTGDHGFASYTKKIHVGSLLHAADLQASWTDQTDGGSAVIYPKPSGATSAVKSDQVCEQLVEQARKVAPGLVHAVSRAELDRLHAFPGAACALEAEIGAAFSDQDDGEILQTLKTPKGCHGYLPTRPEMRAGFVIWGKGVSHGGRKLPETPDIQMPDIAPTAAGILNLRFPVPDGHAIRF